MRPVRRSHASAWLALGLATAGCSATCFLEIAEAARKEFLFGDWAAYAMAVDRFLAGRPIYDAIQLAGPYRLYDVSRIGYAYPPSTIPLFVPFANVPFGLTAWITMNVGLLLVGLAAVLRFELGSFRPGALALVIGGLALYGPFLEGVATGNANVGLAGLLALAWVAGRPSVAVGFLAGAGLAVKIVPGAIVGWARPGAVRSVILAAVVAGGLAVLTLPLVGLSSWFDFVRALSNAVPICPTNRGLLSAACLLQPALGVGLAKAATITLAGALVVLAWMARRETVALVLVAGAWLVPVSALDMHYLIVPYVILVILVARLWGRTVGRSTPAAVPEG